MTFGERGKEPEQKKKKAETRKGKLETKGEGRGKRRGGGPVPVQRVRCVCGCVRTHVCTFFSGGRPGGCRGTRAGMQARRPTRRGGGWTRKFDGSTAEASCQSRQKFCASVFACRQVTSPPIFPRSPRPASPPPSPSASPLHSLFSSPLSHGEFRAADADPSSRTTCSRVSGIGSHVSEEGGTTVRTAWNLNELRCDREKRPGPDDRDGRGGGRDRLRGGVVCPSVCRPSSGVRRLFSSVRRPVCLSSCQTPLGQVRHSSFHQFNIPSFIEPRLGGGGAHGIGAVGGYGCFGCVGMGEETYPRRNIPTHMCPCVPSYP